MQRSPISSRGRHTTLPRVSLSPLGLFLRVSLSC
jgi:hypothetical protein